MITFAKSFVGQLPVLITFYDVKLILLRIHKLKVIWRVLQVEKGGKVMLVGELRKEKEKNTECNLQSNSFANYTLT